MYLAYSAISTIQNHRPQGHQQTEPESELRLRYEGYKNACDKYRHEIAAIQQYLPGWLPKFR